MDKNLFVIGKTASGKTRLMQEMISLGVSFRLVTPRWDIHEWESITKGIAESFTAGHTVIFIDESEYINRSDPKLLRAMLLEIIEADHLSFCLGAITPWPWLRHGLTRDIMETMTTIKMPEEKQLAIDFCLRHWLNRGLLHDRHPNPR